MEIKVTTKISDIDKVMREIIMKQITQTEAKTRLCLCRYTENRLKKSNLGELANSHLTIVRRFSFRKSIQKSQFARLITSYFMIY